MVSCRSALARPEREADVPPVAWSGRKPPSNPAKAVTKKRMRRRGNKNPVMVTPYRPFFCERRASRIAL